MKWLAGWLHSAEESACVRVTLPRLTRPNLVARLYMLFTALGTSAIAWGVPKSSISRIMADGGMTPHIIIALMLTATVLGFLDILANDVAQTQERWGSDSAIGRIAHWLEGRRQQRCFVIGGCYLVLTSAGLGSPVVGTFWLLAYWIQMTFCAGLLAWSLRALMSATLPGGRDAPA